MQATVVSIKSFAPNLGLNGVDDPSYDMWVENRYWEGDLILPIPLDSNASLRTLYDLSDEDFRNEKLFQERCADSGYAGLFNDWPLEYQWLNPRRGGFPDTTLEDTLNQGWERKHVLQARQLCGQCDSIAERLVGSLGRLTCRPQFLDDRDRLRRLWTSIPGKFCPQFPLTRTLRVAQRPDQVKSTRPPESLQVFWREFEEVCHQWQIDGFAAWDLPVPTAPQWPMPRLSPLDDIGTKFRTPTHFSVTTSDSLVLCHP